MQRLFLPLFVVLLASTALADSVITKSGQRIEGKVLSENDNFVVIEVPFSKTIMEKKTIPRDQVVAVERESKDKLAFDRLEKIPTPDTALDVDARTDLLEGHLRPFVESYPNSPYALDVKNRIAPLEEEVAKLEAGSILLFGRWLTPEEQADETYQIEAARLYLEIKKHVAADEFGAALNQFEVLAKKYPGSVAYVRTVPLARRAVEAFTKKVTFELRNLPNVMAERKQSIDRAGVAERPQIEAAIVQQDAFAKEAAERARAARVKFYQILPYDEKGMTDMQKSARSVAGDLDEIDLASLERATKLVNETANRLRKGDARGAEQSLASLDDAWSKYEGLSRFKSHVADLDRSAKAAADAEAKAAKEAEKQKP
ncbi:MAG: PTPDL family protein [Chthoniobacterales bacterium]